MADSSGRGATPELLHYRPWKGTFRPPLASVWPIARTGLLMLLRRRLFWGLYALSMMIFLMYFFGQYLLAWFQTQAGESRVVVGLLVDPSRTNSSKSWPTSSSSTAPPRPTGTTSIIRATW